MTAWKNLSKKEQQKYDDREDYRNERMAGEVFETDNKKGDKTEPSVIKKSDYSGRNATSYVNKEGDLEEITEENNPFKKNINRFDTTATGSGALKGTKRYGATDIRGHLAAGKTEQEILDYAAGLGDDVKMGSAAQNLLAKFKDNIKNGDNPAPEEPSINGEVEGNVLDRGSVIVNGEGIGIGGNDKVKTEYNQDFNGEVNVKGDYYNTGISNSDLSVNNNSFIYKNVGSNNYPMMSGGVSPELPLNYGAGLVPAVSGSVPRPLDDVADKYRDRADAQPLIFSTEGDLKFNQLMGYRGG